VARLFTSLRIAPRRLTVTGYGEFRPVADNATPAGRDKNRRVVLVVLAAPASPGSDDAQPPPNSPQPGPAQAGMTPIAPISPIVPNKP
jgi:chemotaxis protein MotB